MNNETCSTVRDAVTRLGLAGVARALGIPRTTIASYLSGAARPANVELVESRAGRLRPDADVQYQVEVLIGFVMQDDLVRNALVRCVEGIDPDAFKPYYVPDVVARAVAALGRERVSEVIGLRADLIDSISSPECPIFVMNQAKGAVARLRSLTRAAGADDDAEERKP